MFPFPAEPGKPSPADVCLVLLTQSDAMAAAAEAETTARNLLKRSPTRDEQSRGYEDVYKNACSVETLFRCCKDPSDPDMRRPFFARKADIGEYLSQDEIAILVVGYLTFASEVSPIGATDEDDFDAWTTAFVRGGLQTSPLVSWSPVMLIRLVAFLAKRLSTLQTDRSSDSTPRSDTQSGDVTTSPGPSTASSPA